VSLSCFEQPPYATAIGGAVTMLRAFGTRGESISLAFAVRGDSASVDVAVEAGILTGPSAVIDAAAVDVHVVRVWEQAGIGVYQSSPMRVPELLVKDDRVTLRDGYRRWCGHWRHLFRRGRFYDPPVVPLTGPARTTCRAGESKQIWVSVRIPADATPGAYRGAVEVVEVPNADTAVPSAQGTRRRVPMEIEVLPYSLAEPVQDLMMWYKGRLDCRFPQQYVTPETFETQLRDIYDHGFRSISISEYDPALVSQALEIANAVGFRRNVVMLEPYPDVSVSQSLGALTPVYYLSDELDARSATAISHHLENWHDARRRGARGMASLLHQASARRFAEGGDIGHAPDIMSYYLPHNQPYFLAHAEFPQARAGDRYYYWLTHMEKPLVHRVLAGFYLWKSGASGIAPYCYQHLPVFPNSPFDDFDEWEPGFHVGAERRPFKDHMTTYPARGGTIPTLQWKGLSDGIGDLRYLTTLDHALAAAAAHERAAVRDLAAEARARADAILRCISLTRIDIVSERDASPYADMDSGDCARYREQIARDIAALLEAAGTEAPRPAVA
jgi:hypothetical protein